MPQRAGVWRIVEIPLHTIGSVRLDGGRVRALMAVLGKYVALERVTVELLSREETLEYPADDVHQAIDDYDVKTLSVSGYRGGHVEDLKVRVSLPPSGLHGVAFRFEGPMDAVPPIVEAVRVQVRTWPHTSHWIAHRGWVWGVFALICLAISLAGSPLGHPIAGSLVSWSLLGTYIAINFRADALAPYVWFER